MNKLRFYIAMLASRFVYFSLRLIGRNASHMPGVIAKKICPNVLEYLEPSDKFIAVTGTNGKTSTSNMIVSFLEAQGIDYAANLLGSNIEGGIITTLLTSTSFFGKNKKEYLVLEVDERISLQIFPYIQPNILAVTNLYRDSYDRNAHVDFIYEILQESIPESTLLVLNGDDILTSSLKPNNKRKYFSIAPMVNEKEVRDSIIQDAPYCPNCGAKLIYDFQRYHHIGQVHCNNCGLSNKEADYILEDINNESMIVNDHNQKIVYENHSDNLSELYNKLTAISVLREMGFTHKSIMDHFSTIKVVESRYNEKLVNGKRYITMLSKDQNPVANSRAFDFIRSKEEWGKTVIVIMTEEHSYTQKPNFVENVAYIYDTNFEYLNIDRISDIYVVGSRIYEFKSRLLIAGIDETKIHVSETIPNIKNDYDTIIVLHNLKNIAVAMKYHEELIRGDR